MQFNALEFVPERVSHGYWLTAWTLPRLLQRLCSETPILPVCRWGTAASRLQSLGSLVLPPLYFDAIPGNLCDRILNRIGKCFPFYLGDVRRGSTSPPFTVVRLDEPVAATRVGEPAQIVAFSVDTAVEQHGPHLPLATDTVQSYAVLKKLAEEHQDVFLAPPVDYGHLTWGLPFGVSIDLGPALLSEYVAEYARCVIERMNPAALYVVDVHGSIVHREAIQAGLRSGSSVPWKFRWLHDPLVDVSGGRGDQHAGGVETAILHAIDPALVDAGWFPARRDELAAGQMTVAEAAALSSDMPRFLERAARGDLNGIVGDLRNFDFVDGNELLGRMVQFARNDLRELRTAL